MKFLCALAASLVIFPAAYAQAPTPPAAPPAPAAAPPSDPNKVIITIGDQKITVAQFEDLVNALPQQYQALARGAQKRQFAQQLVQIRVLSDEATKRKIDQQPKIQSEILFNRDNILAGAMFQALQQEAKVDDAAVAKYYDEHKAEFEAVRARHILIRVKGSPMPAASGKTELTDEQALAKAQDIRKKILAGEDFGKLAQAESDDTGSATKGGDLGEFKKGMMVPPFEQAAFAAKVGEVTDPVKSQFGYHVIKVEAHTTKTLDEARPEILAKLRPDAAKAELEALQAKEKVTMDDAFFPPTPPPAAPALQPIE